MPDPIKVLLLAADPEQRSGGLRLDQEIRRALEGIRMGRSTTALEIAAELAVRRTDLLPALLRHRPQILHFAGHGSHGQGILLDSADLLRSEELATLLVPDHGVRVVVLNACTTLPVAEALSATVDYVVAMELAINDKAAVVFAGAFYAALSFGRSVASAFEVARAALQERHGRDHALPTLLRRKDAEEWPANRHAVPAEDVLALVQENLLADVEVDGDLRSRNESSGTAAGRTKQVNSASRTTIAGSAYFGNRA
jgi:hypothetical protein